MFLPSELLPVLKRNLKPLINEKYELDYYYLGFKVLDSKTKNVMFTLQITDHGSVILKDKDFNVIFQESWRYMYQYGYICSNILFIIDHNYMFEVE